jgi:hypothetical protein
VILGGQELEESQVPGTISATLLWLFVVTLGIAFGAGLYEHRIVVSRWITSSESSGSRWNADTARRDDTGRRFWALVTTVPLTLLTLANLFVASRSSGTVQWWWLAAGLAALAERMLTFSYFIPTMVGLMQAPDSPNSVVVATRWSRLNHVRHAMVLVAWLTALRAFALFYQQRS